MLPNRNQVSRQGVTSSEKPTRKAVCIPVRLAGGPLQQVPNLGHRRRSTIDRAGRDGMAWVSIDC